MGRSSIVEGSFPAIGGLPAEPDTFIGRERDLRELHELFGPVRAVTLCAPGGMGKTRLAVHLGLEIASEYADGCRLVDLAPLNEPRLVATRVADQLGVVDEPGRDRTDTLIDALRPRSMLLILDNCEHVIDVAAELCARLLAGCPRLRLLATSREPLRIHGETVFRLPPLTVPATGEAASEQEAVRRFTARASAVWPGFRLTPDVSGQVARVCRALDGMPLAIELAAARASVLSPREIADRLGDRFRLLTGGDRTAPARQRTLRAAVDWSHDLLDPAERLLFRRLAAFSGGFTLAAAETVCADGDLPAADVFDLLTSLVDKSLVLRDGSSAAGTRFSMLETIRTYAAERLAGAAETERLRRAHRDHMQAVAEDLRRLAMAEGVPASSPDRASDPLTVLDPEYSNLLAALVCSVEHGDTEPALRIAHAAALYWGVRGRLTEGVGWLDRVLALAGKDAHPALRAAVLSSRAQLKLECGDVAGAEDDARRSVEPLRAVGDYDALGSALHVMATIRLRAGAHAEAARILTDASEEMAGRNRWVEAVIMSDLGGVAMAQGDWDEAGRRLSRANELYDRHGLAWGRARGLISLGILAQRRGDLATARGSLLEALTACKAASVPTETARCLVALARLAMTDGDGEQARTHIAEAIRGSRDSGQRLALARALELAAELALRDDDPARAVRLAGASAALREAVEGRPPGVRFAPLLDAARAALGGADQDLWQEGLELDTEHAVRLALEHDTHVPNSTAAPGGTATPSGTATPGSTAVPSGTAAGEPHALAGGTAAGENRTLAGDAAGAATVLTAREREIAVLVARGLSNKAIAEELYISPATAARHVANIFTKLDLGSRTQIATWAIEHGLT